MKRSLILFLTALLVFSFAACNGESEESVVFSGAEISENDESTEQSREDSSASEVSEESKQPLPDFIANFVSIGTVDTKVNAQSPNSICLTAIDGSLEYGAIVLYTSEYGSVSGAELEEFAVAVFEYNEKLFGYSLKSFAEVGKAEDVSVPEDGFVIAAHSTRKAYIDKLAKIPASETVFPHGLHLYKGADVTIKKASTAINVDGSFNAEEWEAYHVGEIKPESPNWSYAQFDAGNYYSLGNYYMTYDDSYVYLAVVIKSPYHFCPIAPDTAGDMWKYECIQVKASEVSPAGDYIAENYDHVINKTAHNEGVVHSYGFAANDNGETCFYESGTDFTGLAGCSRDDATQTTVYEVAISWESLEITPEEGVEFGLTFSVNSTSEEDFNNGGWKNVTLRNGGGVIGRNDWSKIPVITLG